MRTIREENQVAGRAQLRRPGNGRADALGALAGAMQPNCGGNGMLSIDYRAEPILGCVSYSRNFTMFRYRWRCCWRYLDQLHGLEW